MTAKDCFRHQLLARNRHKLLCQKHSWRSICQAPLRVSWGDRVSSSVMKLWQMDAGRFPIQPVRTLCPDYEAGTLSGNTHTHISKLSECTRLPLVNWCGWSSASILLITPLSCIPPLTVRDVILSVNERASHLEKRGERETVCHMPLNEPASGKFLLIHQPMLGNEGEAEGRTHSTLSAILLSLLIMQGNYSYMPHSLHAPSLQRVPFSFFQPLHATLMPSATWINNRKIRMRRFRRRRQQLGSLPGLWHLARSTVAAASPCSSGAPIHN